MVFCCVKRFHAQAESQCFHLQVVCKHFIQRFGIYRVNSLVAVNLFVTCRQFWQELASFETFEAELLM